MTSYPLQFLMSHQTEFLENWVIIALLLIIITLAGCYEFCTAKLLKVLQKQNVHGLEKILKGIFKELTILGFISLILFSLCQWGITQWINDKIFGQSAIEKVAIEKSIEEGEFATPPTELVEIFEDIHMFIFGIMVLYILNAAILLIIGRRMILKFTNLESQFQQKIINSLMSKDDASEIHGGPCWNDFVLFYGLRERFLHPKIPFFPRPKQENFPFATYLCLNYTDILVEMIEIPLPSLLLVFFVCCLMRPLLIQQGVWFLYVMVSLAFLLLLISVTAKIMISRVYYKLLPNTEFIKQCLKDIQIPEGSITRRATLKHAASHLQEALVAPIDEIPVFTKGIFGMMNRVEKQMLGLKSSYIEKGLQLILFFNSCFVTVILHESFSTIHNESRLWWEHRMWVYPLTIGIVLINLLMIFFVLKEFVYLTCLDCNTKEKIITEVDNMLETRKKARLSQILSSLLNAASHALVTETKEKMAAEMERVQLVFNGLPHDAQNLITLLFVTVSQYHDQLGHGSMRGVVTKAKMKEALRLMGWSTHSVSCSIMLSWFETKDTRQQGYLTFDEFVQVILLSTPLGQSLKDQNKCEAERNEETLKLFEIIDKNHDHVISLDEIELMLKKIDIVIPREEIRLFIEHISNSNDTITYEDLVAFTNRTNFYKELEEINAM